MSLIDYIEDIKNASELLSTSKETDYSQFSKALDVFSKYTSLSSEDRDLVKKELNERSLLNSLIVSSEKLGLNSLLYDDPTRSIFASLICLSIENFRLDPRENFLRLSIIWYVVNKCKIKLDPILDKINQISSDHTKEFIEDFFSRDDYLKSPRAMGFKIIKKGKNIYLKQRKPYWER